VIGTGTYAAVLPMIRAEAVVLLITVGASTKIAPSISHDGQSQAPGGPTVPCM
jgi:hypothetical protein